MRGNELETKIELEIQEAQEKECWTNEEGKLGERTSGNWSTGDKVLAILTDRSTKSTSVHQISGYSRSPAMM